MKKKGISLITLVITIVVVIILAAAVILSISKNNPINDAKKAKIASTIDTFKSDLSVQISNKLLKEPMITVNEIDSDEIKEGFKITDLVPSISGTEYESELIVINGKLKLKKDSSFPKEKQEIIIELLGPIEEDNESDDNDDENEEIIPEQKTYQITYDVNGGNELFENQTKKENETLVLNTNVPTKEGYIFEGWKATDETIYQPGVEYTKNEETVLTAQWKKELQAIVFSSAAGLRKAASGAVALVSALSTNYSVYTSAKLPANCRVEYYIVTYNSIDGSPLSYSTYDEANANITLGGISKVSHSSSGQSNKEGSFVCTSEAELRCSAVGKVVSTGSASGYAGAYLTMVQLNISSIVDIETGEAYELIIEE